MKHKYSAGSSFAQPISVICHATTTWAADSLMSARYRRAWRVTGRRANLCTATQRKGTLVSPCALCPGVRRVAASGAGLPASCGHGIQAEQTMWHLDAHRRLRGSERPCAQGGAPTETCSSYERWQGEAAVERPIEFEGAVAACQGYPHRLTGQSDQSSQAMPGPSACGRGEADGVAD